jgi:hypothetical protein
MSNTTKRVEVTGTQGERMILTQKLLSRTRLVVEMPDGSPKQLEFQSRDAWGTPYYSDGQFRSTGRKYVPQGCYIVEDSQDFKNAMRAL